MGSSETDKPAKDPKTPGPISSQDQSSATSTASVNVDWSGFQAYSPIPPPGFLASNPQAHPYMWSVQHMMPPYGTPPHPYVAMYPHGVYAHPSMPPGSYPFSPFAMASPNGIAEASGITPTSADADGKHPQGKEKFPIKRSKGSLGSLNMITGKSNEEGKTTGAATNGSCSKSAESASDGSSEGSDANSQNDSGGRQEAHEADQSQSGNSDHVAQNGVSNSPHPMVNHGMAIVPITAPGAPISVAGPATNLNIGMDYWGPPASSPVQAMRGNVSSAPGVVPAGSQDKLQPQIWLQDERELKRQRRKQSNRESARRSRLRKQAECDELSQRAEALKEENANLRSELNRFRSDYEKLMAENNVLKERLGELPEGLGSSRAEHHIVSETQESGKTDQV